MTLICNKAIIVRYVDLVISGPECMYTLKLRQKFTCDAGGEMVLAAVRSRDDEQRDDYSNPVYLNMTCADNV